MILWCEEGYRTTLPGKCDVPQGEGAGPAQEPYAWEDLAILPPKHPPPRKEMSTKSMEHNDTDLLSSSPASASPLAIPSFVGEEVTCPRPLGLITKRKERKLLPGWVLTKALRPPPPSAQELEGAKLRFYVCSGRGL